MRQANYLVGDFCLLKSLNLKQPEDPHDTANRNILRAGHTGNGNGVFAMMIGITEVSKIIGVSPGTIKYWESHRPGFPAPAQRVGGRKKRLWKLDDIKAWLRENPVKKPHRRKWPFAAMDVGEMLIFSTERAKLAMDMAHSYGSHSGKFFACRTQVDGSIKIWRLE